MGQVIKITKLTDKGKICKLTCLLPEFFYEDSVSKTLYLELTRSPKPQTLELSRQFMCV
jgi:hypothetical protein